ncbi:MAG: molybdate ABC transporter substrate-binding protein [Terriglobales bacterium]
MKIRSLCASIALFLIASVSLCCGQTIAIAAASDLQFAFQDVATRFEKASGKQVKLIFGSSGNFFAQIENGAPFDLFFSADLNYAKKLDAAGLAEPGSLYEYATGKIVLLAPRQSHVDVERGLQVLLDPTVKKIAIANPAHAPYGRAAVAALRHENLYDRVEGKFVLGENISQTASFVTSGSADVGVIALSLALAPAMKDEGKYAEIPAIDYPPIKQAAIILKSSREKDIAREFMAFVKSPEIMNLLKKYGFSVPANAGTGP